MNLILAIPLGVRLAALFALGMLAGGLVNWCVYALAWNRRAISPWSAPPQGAARRTLRDRLPLVGWLALKRESDLFGRGHWVRPLAVELVCGALFAGLYYFELHWAAQALVVPAAVQPPAGFLTTSLDLVFHLRFVSHVLLVLLMLAASLVDLDEKTIPDAITVSGTLVGLALALAYPWSLLPGGDWLLAQGRAVEFLALTSPNGWQSTLAGWPPGWGLGLALGAWTLWCGGLMPRIWRTRRGLGVAWRLFIHRLFAERVTYWLAGLWAIGAAVVVLAAWRAPEAHWAGLLSALAGVAGGGGVVWCVRTIGSLALGKEAMGFGDVTLLSMIGAFLGWQAALVVFFVAPFFGLLLAVANWAAHGEHEIPYGPFLCLGALTVLLKWNAVWLQVLPIFELGWVVPALAAVCLVLLGLMLTVYRLLVGAFSRSS